jgi:NADP-dependent aldehyde dehydrogenase
MQISPANFIGFSTSSKGQKTFQSFNPILNHEIEHSFFEATEDEIDAAMQLAKKAFPFLAQTTGKSRAVFLREIGNLLEINRSELIHQYSLESGLNAERGNVELNRTIWQLETFARTIEQENWDLLQQDEADLARLPNPKPAFRKVAFPLGPVVVFGASNFPFAYSTVGGDTASALAAGCPVIVKSHPMHAGTSNLVAQLVIEAARKTGMPDGTFSHLNAVDFEVGTKLVLHPNTKAVGFTGSFAGGMALQKLSQQRDEPIPVFAEMGSLNPIVILPQAMQNDGSKIALQIANSITQSAGQFCTKPGLLFVLQHEHLDDFLDQLKTNFEAVEPQCMLHPNIWKRYNHGRETISSQENVATWIDVKTKKPNFGTPQISQTNGKTFPQNRKLQEEVFGPHSLLIICENLSELQSCIQSLSGQLTASIFASAEEMKNHFNILFDLQQIAGRIILNGVPTGVEVCDSMHHGGPFPATTDSRFTAVGKDAIWRFLRPISFQNLD